MSAGAASAQGRAVTNEQARDRHQARIVRDGLREWSSGHRGIEERSGDQPEQEARRAERIGAGIRREQPAEDAADPGDATVEGHQHHGGDADQSAANRRSKWCELRDYHGQPLK